MCLRKGRSGGRTMLRGGWREHVRAELQKRERRGRSLRVLVERHENLQERLEAQRAFLEATLEAQAGGSRGPPGEQLLRREAELRELRRERDQLLQQVALLTEIARETEAKSQEQQARMRPLAQSLSALTRQYEEAQCKAWILSREAEGMRRGLEKAQQLLEEARRERQDLEARWVEEKALEAKRLNRANEQEEKYRQKILRLREKLEKAGEAAGH